MSKTRNLARLSNTFDVNDSGAVSVGGSTGTSGQVLTSQGSGAAPQWSTATPGLTYLATITPGSGTTTAAVTGLGAYESFILISSDLTLTSSSPLRFELSADNGSTYGSPTTLSGSSSTPTFQLQIFRAKTSGTEKPYTYLPGAFPSVGRYTSTLGIINAIRLSVTTTFSGTGVVYVYGMG